MLLLVTVGQAWAATYVVTSGNWISQQTWNRNNTGGTLSPYVYDNGEQFPSAVLGGTPGIIQWSPSQPAQQTGTYSGSLIVDENNIVVGGWLSVDGTIANEVRAGSGSWWAHQYADLYIDFKANTASTSAYTCYETIIVPATCLAGGAGPAANVFAPLEGNVSASGPGRYGATFDGNELKIFREGYAQGAGTDYENTFALTTANFPSTVVPIPAAAWLFMSGLGLLGLKKNKVK